MKFSINLRNGAHRPPPAVLHRHHPRMEDVAQTGQIQRHLGGQHAFPRAGGESLGIRFFHHVQPPAYDLANEGGPRKEGCPTGLPQVHRTDHST